MDGESKSLNQYIIQKWIQTGGGEWNDSKKKRKRDKAERDHDGGWRGGNQSFQSFLIVRLQSQER